MSQSPNAETTASRIAIFISQLDSALLGDGAMESLISCGKPAIPSLSAFLSRRPSSLPEGRKRAVRALGQLGARDTLQQFVSSPADSDDPVVRLAEGEVESLAASELRRWPDTKTENALLCAVERRLSLGGVFALGELRSARALPLLIQALGDDTCHIEAEMALLKIRVPIRQALIEVLLAKAATPTDTRRQIRAARILLSGPSLTIDEWSLFESPLAYANDDLSIAISRLGLRSASPDQRSALLRNILHRLHGISWITEAEILEVLEIYRETALPLVDECLEELRKGGFSTNLADPEWRVMLSFRNQQLGPQRTTAGGPSR